MHPTTSYLFITNAGYANGKKINIWTLNSKTVFYVSEYRNYFKKNKSGVNPEKKNLLF